MCEEYPYLFDKFGKCSTIYVKFRGWNFCKVGRMKYFEGKIKILVGKGNNALGGVDFRHK
jgi:hypothetical protein